MSFWHLKGPLKLVFLTPVKMSLTPQTCQIDPFTRALYMLIWRPKCDTLQVSNDAYIFFSVAFPFRLATKFTLKRKASFHLFLDDSHFCFWGNERRVSTYQNITGVSQGVRRDRTPWPRWSKVKTVKSAQAVLGYFFFFFNPISSCSIK